MRRAARVVAATGHRGCRVRTPRRYRLALLAYPASYRADRGPELVATLAEGDEERGRPSVHESAALVRARHRHAGAQARAP